MRQAAFEFRPERAKELILLRAETRGKPFQLFDGLANAIAGLRRRTLSSPVGLPLDFRFPIVQERVSRLWHGWRRESGRSGFKIVGWVRHLRHDWFLCGPGIFLSRPGCNVSPVRWRGIHAPDVGRAFQLDCNLEELADGMRPLNPRDSRTHVAHLGALRNLERDPTVSRQVVLGRVAASVQIKRQRGRALFEWLAEQIDAAHDHRNRFGDSLAATALGVGLVRVHGAHQIPQTHERSIALSVARVERRKIEKKATIRKSFFRRDYFFLDFRSFTRVDVPPLN